MTVHSLDDPKARKVPYLAWRQPPAPSRSLPAAVGRPSGPSAVSLHPPGRTPSAARCCAGGKILAVAHKISLTRVCTCVYYTESVTQTAAHLRSGLSQFNPSSSLALRVMPLGSRNRSVLFRRLLPPRPFRAISCSSWPYCRSAARIPTHFCPRPIDRIPTSVNPTCASRSIATAAPPMLSVKRIIRRKPTNNSPSIDQYSLRFVTSRQPIARRFPLRFVRRHDKTIQFRRLSAIFESARQNSRSVISRFKPHSCNPIAMTKIRRCYSPVVPRPLRPVRIRPASPTAQNSAIRPHAPTLATVLGAGEFGWPRH
jgi:hypothetical protein